MLSLYLIILDTIVHKLLTFQVIRLISSIIDFVLECIFVWKENFKWFIKFVFKKKKKGILFIIQRRDMHIFGNDWKRVKFFLFPFAYLAFETKYSAIFLYLFEKYFAIIA